MSTDDLLRRLADRSVTLFLDGDSLRFRAKAGTLTPELRDEVAACRMAIIEHLRMRATCAAVPHHCGYCDWRDWRDEPPRDGRIRTTCGRCGRFIGYRPTKK